MRGGSGGFGYELLIIVIFAIGVVVFTIGVLRTSDDLREGTWSPVAVLLATVGGLLSFGPLLAAWRTTAHASGYEYSYPTMKILMVGTGILFFIGGASGATSSWSESMTPQAVLAIIYVIVPISLHLLGR